MKHVEYTDIINEQQFNDLLELNCAIVYLLVDWSGPERASRQSVFNTLSTIGQSGTPVFRIDCSDQNNKYVGNWLKKENVKGLYYGGYGETLLIENGHIIDYLKNPGEIGIEQLFKKLSAWKKHAEEKELSDEISVNNLQEEGMMPFDAEFCLFLEYHLSETFANSNNEVIKYFWCDGINSEFPVKDKKYINDNRKLETIAWIGTDGNSKYRMIINFGSKSLSRYARGLGLRPCVPSSENMDWINLDTENLTIELFFQ